MTLEKQVCSLEIAKRLKELGVKQESLFYFQGTTGEFEVGKGYIISFGKEMQFEDVVNISAFTVAEIEKLVPFEINLPFKNGKKRSHNHWRVIGKPRPNGYAARYVGGNSFTNIEVQAETFADSLAQMLIYLLENKLITIQ